MMMMMMILITITITYIPNTLNILSTKAQNSVQTKDDQNKHSPKKVTSKQGSGDRYDNSRNDRST